MNWDDPAARARLAEAVGPAEYNRQHEQHMADVVTETVNGHAIRPVSTRFGRLHSVGDSGRAFVTLEQARAFARQEKPGVAPEPR